MFYGHYGQDQMSANCWFQWRKGSSGQKMKGELGEKDDQWKVTPEVQKEIESVSQNNMVGNYFQIGFGAWIQHSGKKTYTEL